MKPCEGCAGLFKENECYIAVKDDEFKIHVYGLTPDFCPCKDCIVKMTCKSFCDLVIFSAKDFGIEIDG